MDHCLLRSIRTTTTTGTTSTAYMHHAERLGYTHWHHAQLEIRQLNWDGAAMVHHDWCIMTPNDYEPLGIMPWAKGVEQHYAGLKVLIAQHLI